jgi:inorganic phosphate transporter, PiT family
MTDVALTAGASPKPKLDHPIAPTTAILFVTILLAGILYAGLNIYLEVRDAGVVTESWLPFLLLGIALLIALGFEFVNGFHDTANAVATVIYTHSLAPMATEALTQSGMYFVASSSGHAAAIVDPRDPGADLYRRVLRPRLE